MNFIYEMSSIGFFYWWYICLSLKMVNCWIDCWSMYVGKLQMNCPFGINKVVLIWIWIFKSFYFFSIIIPEQCKSCPHFVNKVFKWKKVWAPALLQPAAWLLWSGKRLQLVHVNNTAGWELDVFSYNCCSLPLTWHSRRRKVRLTILYFHNEVLHH